MAHHVGDEDLATFRMSAQAGGLDDRDAEVVVVFHVGIPERHSHPHHEWLARPAVAGVERLLDLDGAGGSLGGAVGHDHEPVTEVLDLPAAGPGDGVPKDPEVLAAKLLGPLFAHARQQCS